MTKCFRALRQNHRKWGY